MREFRGYAIEQAPSGRYIARPLDGDDFHVSSRSIDLIYRAIRQLWEATDFLTVDVLRSLEPDLWPVAGWIRSWLRTGSNHVNLDVAYSNGEL